MRIPSGGIYRADYPRPGEPRKPAPTRPEPIGPRRLPWVAIRRELVALAWFVVATSATTGYLVACLWGLVRLSGETWF